jgi:hypothetical protein
MLDECEWIEVTDALAQQPEDRSLRDGLDRVHHVYARLTGVDSENPNAILHHRLVLCGPPCGRCGKPLRTAAAAFCAACGSPTPCDT